MREPEAELGAFIRAFQGGDPKALDEVVRRLQGPLLRLAACVLRDHTEAEDAFIDSMARLLPALRTFDHPDKFASYARRVVRNHCVDLLRRRVERDSRRALRDTARATGPWEDAGAYVERLAAAGRGPEQELLRVEQLLLVRQAVEELGEPGRSVVRLVYGQGLTYQEVAEQLSLSRSKVKRTLSTTRCLLAVRLREGGSDDAS